MGLLIDGFRADRGSHQNPNPLEEAGKRMANSRIEAAQQAAKDFAAGNSIDDRYHNNTRIGVAVIDAWVEPDFILLVANNTITEITFQEACAWREKIFAANAVDILSAQEDAKAQELVKAADEGYTLDVRAIAEELGFSTSGAMLDGLPLDKLPTIAGLYPMGKLLKLTQHGGRGRGRWTDYIEYDLTTKTVVKKYSVRDDGVVDGGDIQHEKPIVIQATPFISNNPFADLLNK